jgi:hypothetical protein
MQSKTLTRFLTISLLATSFALPASSTKSQESATRVAQVPVAQSPCPKALALTIPANSSSNVFAGDFTPTQLAGAVGLNYPGSDKPFVYTFQWRREQTCCQVTKAVLTVRMRSNQPGQSKTSYDAGNDSINIMHGGNSIYGEAVYSGPPPLWPFPVNQLAVKQWTWTLNASTLSNTILSNINNSNRLSFYVQDDTRVESATLQLSGCCLSTPQRVVTEAVSPN